MQNGKIKELQNIKAELEKQNANTSESDKELANYYKDIWHHPRENSSYDKNITDSQTK